MKKDQLTETAYHEAGHVIAALRLKIPFKHVTIVPDDENNSLGHVRMDKYIIKILKRMEVSTVPGGDIQKIHDSIIVLLSGFYAEKKLTGRNNNVGASQDFHSVAGHAIEICGSSASATALVKYLSIVCEELISNRWKHIDCMAKALLKKKTLSYEETKEIHSKSTGSRLYRDMKRM